MRIALVSQEYPPETAKGGLGTQTYAKAHGLARRGHEVYVISRSTDGHTHEYWDHSVHVTRIPGFENAVPLYTDVADWITYSAQVSAAVSARHAVSPLDIVDFPEWAAEGYVYLLNQSDWNRTATVVQLHGPLVLFAHKMHWPAINSEFYRTGTMLESTCLRLADALYTSSRYSADFAARAYQLPNDSIPLIHAGVDTTRFTPRGEPLPARPTIVFAGKLVHNKGVFQLVAAAIELARELPDLHLRLLGRAEESIVQELTRRAAAAGRPGLLELAGFVAHDQLPAEYNRAHVFAAPAPHEPGPGLVYLEAMACGLPVIACEGSGATEVVDHEQTGLLVPPNDKDALVAALRRLLTNDVFRQEMGARARRYAVERADGEKGVARLEEFYESVVHRRLTYASSRSA
jgi:glycosyltransferase involved in cell wall biosynthesis